MERFNSGIKGLMCLLKWEIKSFNTDLNTKINISNTTVCAGVTHDGALQNLQ
jgi:hypothetical protein